MNYGHFAGRLGRDAELRSTPSGQSVANFALAVDAGWGDNKQTLWVDCAIWGERAEKLAPYLVKGKQVSVSGDLGLRTFEKRDKTAGASITLSVQRLTLQGGGNGEAATGPTSEQRAQVERAPAARAAAPAPAAATEDFNDDIPF